MIDKESARWGFGKHVKPFLRTPTMIDLEGSNPTVFSYFAASYNDLTTKDKIIEELRAEYQKALSEIGESNPGVKSNGK